MADSADSVEHIPPGIRLLSVTVPGWVRDDPEWSAAVWLLCWSPSIWRRVEHHVDFDAAVIHFDRMIDFPWSSGERRIIECAWSLYNDGWAKDEGHAVSIGDLAAPTLGDNHLAACLHAVEIRRGKAVLPNG